MQRSALAVLLCAGRALATDVVEYVGIASPNSESVSWAKVTYPANFTATSTSEVSIEDVSSSETVDALGAWQDLSLGGEPMLTARVWGDNLYAQLNTGTAPTDNVPGGCCADTLRIFGKDDGGEYSDIDIYSIVSNTLGSMSDTMEGWAYANHAFQMTTLDGYDAPVALIDVCYMSSTLNGALSDAIIAVDTATGDVIPTADGDDYFSWYEHTGTMSTTASDGIYKIQFFEMSSGGSYLDEDTQQFHQNGIEHFVSTSGNESVTVLAATHKSHGEAVLVKCPWTYSSAQNGGGVLQRFGSPSTNGGSTTHTFGLEAGANDITALHNIFFNRYDDGTETLTIFVNAQDGSSVSQVYEFGVNLVAEADAGDYDDTVFATTYQHGSLDFSENTWGGARPVGSGGLWLVGRDGLEALSSSSSSSAPPPPEDDHSGPPGEDDSSSTSTQIYDSFIRVVV